MIFECSNDVVHYGIWSMATTLGFANLVRVSPSLCDEVLYVENHCEISKERNWRNMRIVKVLSLTSGMTRIVVQTC